MSKSWKHRAIINIGRETRPWRWQWAVSNAECNEHCYWQSFGNNSQHAAHPPVPILPQLPEIMSTITDFEGTFYKVVGRFISQNECRNFINYTLISSTWHSHHALLLCVH